MDKEPKQIINQINDKNYLVKKKLSKILDLMRDDFKKENKSINIGSFSKTIAPVLIEKYAKNLEEGKRKKIESYIKTRLFLDFLTIIKTLPDHDIRGKTIVDLGCGSTGGTADYGTEDLHGQQFHPWLMRACHELGVNAIGVDMGNLDEEPFEHYNANLAEQNSIHFLQDSMADIVIVQAVYDSGTMVFMPGWRHHGLDGVGIKKDLHKILLPQIKRILKDGGVLIDDLGYKEEKIIKKEEI